MSGYLQRMRTPTRVLGTSLLVAMVATGAAGGPSPAPAPAPPPAAEPKPAADPKALAAADKRLARAYGTARATLGPLFGTMKIGRITSSKWRGPIEHAGVPVIEDMLMGPGADPIPEDAELKIRLNTASGPPSIHSDTFYFDGADIIVRNADLCAQLGQRLEQLWGPQKGPWTNAARHQAAQLDLETKPGISCTLRIFHTPTTGGAHCAPDEMPVSSQEVDARRGCLKADRPIACEVVRYSDRIVNPPRLPRMGINPADCRADDVHHKFYAGQVPGSVEARSCTRDELDSLHFSDLPPCKQ
jgi:hypothetical protein